VGLVVIEGGLQVGVDVGVGVNVAVAVGVDVAVAVAVEVGVAVGVAGVAGRISSAMVPQFALALREPFTDKVDGPPK